MSASQHGEGIATALLSRLLGRLPIGWLQLKHNAGRLAAAVGGVVFASLLILMQLGFLGALGSATVLPYGLMKADVLISAADANSLNDGGAVPRRRLYQALATPGAARAEALYTARLELTQPSGDTAVFTLFGAAPSGRFFAPEVIGDKRADLQILDTAIMDWRTRGLDADLVEKLKRGEPFQLESNGRTLRILGGLEVGGGFEADGYMIVSDATFLKLFPSRSAGAPDHILVGAAPGASAETLAAALRARLPDGETKIRPVRVAASDDRDYQTTERPVGVVFGFGVAIGALVGVIIVYQILSSDVADHLAEYATLKAVGYAPKFFLGVIFEEALILAVLGFFPGLALSLGLYRVVNIATGLPLEMTVLRAVGVFAAILAICALSGALAARRLDTADPAELF